MVKHHSPWHVGFFKYNNNNSMLELCRTRRWTVLRSPHVDKDSRETFQQKTHKRLIDVKDITNETIQHLMQLDVPAGVGIRVSLLE